MKIDENLQKKIEEVRRNSNDNSEIELLDLIGPLEQTYGYINESILKEWNPSMYYRDDALEIKSKKYIPEEYKTVYEMGKRNGYSLLDIIIYNNGTIDFEKRSDRVEDEKLIKGLIGSNEVLDLFSSDAELSFFRDNQEFVISKEPYLAIKMANFEDENKAVLVVKNNDNETLIIEEIKDYLKKIKIDIDNIPNLTYAFFDEKKSRRLRKKINLELKQSCCDRWRFTDVFYSYDNSLSSEEKLYGDLKKASIIGKKKQKKIMAKKGVIKNQIIYDAIFEAGDMPIKEDDSDAFPSYDAMYQNSVDIYHYLVENDEDMFRKTLDNLEIEALIRTYHVVRHVVLNKKMDEQIDICNFVDEIISTLKKLSDDKTKKVNKASKTKKLIKGFEN